MRTTDMGTVRTRISGTHKHTHQACDHTSEATSDRGNANPKGQQAASLPPRRDAHARPHAHEHTDRVVVVRLVLVAVAGGGVVVDDTRHFRAQNIGAGARVLARARRKGGQNKQTRKQTNAATVRRWHVSTHRFMLLCCASRAICHVAGPTSHTTHAWRTTYTCRATLACHVQDDVVTLARAESERLQQRLASARAEQQRLASELASERCGPVGDCRFKPLCVAAADARLASAVCRKGGTRLPAAAPSGEAITGAMALEIATEASRLGFCL